MEEMVLNGSFPRMRLGKENQRRPWGESRDCFHFAMSGRTGIDEFRAMDDMELKVISHLTADRKPRERED